jgi:hypothetical protein
MKAACTTVLSLAIALAVLLSAQADEAKKVTLKGNLVCGKCKLKETDICSNALVVKKDGKEEIYWLKDKGKKEKYHACTAPKAAEVTGTVSTKDGKKYITPEKGGVKLLKKSS